MAAAVFIAMALVQAVRCSPIVCGCSPLSIPGQGSFPLSGLPVQLPGPVLSSPVPIFDISTGGGIYGVSGGSGLPVGSAIAGLPGAAFEEGCCPGPVVEQKRLIQKPVTTPFTFTEPTFNQQCFQKSSVSRDVVPKSFETGACQTVQQVTTVPTTDTTTVEQPLCKTTCTTSEYVLQIPIVETTCTSSPLCKKTVQSQNKLVTNVAKKTTCAKQVCTQNQVINRPVTETVCQNFQGAVTKAGSQTVLKPEIIKSCFQLPPRKCLKPATGPGVFVDFGNGATPVAGQGAFTAAPAPVFLDSTPQDSAPVFFSGGLAGTPGSAPVLIEGAFAPAQGSAPAPAYIAEAFAAAPIYLPPPASSCSCSCKY